MADEDFQEGEVWSHVKECSRDWRAKDHHSHFSPSSSSSSRRLIPRVNANAEGSGVRNQRQQSAPVNIPEWSKTYRSNSNGSVEESVVDNNIDEFDDEQLPPHEWIAKKLARSQISSSSVCEGAGRTLKGRDQREVRNAVLTRTGFLE